MANARSVRSVELDAKIAEMVAQGLSQTEIGDALGFSWQAVASRVKRMRLTSPKRRGTARHHAKPKAAAATRPVIATLPVSIPHSPFLKAPTREQLMAGR